MRSAPFAEMSSASTAAPRLSFATMPVIRRAGPAAPVAPASNAVVPVGSTFAKIVTAPTGALFASRNPGSPKITSDPLALVPSPSRSPIAMDEGAIPLNVT